MNNFTGRLLDENDVYTYVIEDEVAAIHTILWNYMWMNGIGVWNGTSDADKVPTDTTFFIVNKQRNLNRSAHAYYIKTGKRQ